MCCPLGYDGYHYARELAEAQTLENLEAFGDRLERAYALMLESRRRGDAAAEPVHEWQAVRDGGLWRAACSCGWRSRLARYKSGAERAGRYHVKGPVTARGRPRQTAWSSTRKDAREKLRRDWKAGRYG